MNPLVFIGKVRADVSKRGVDDGNQKGGGSLQPAKKNQCHYTIKNINVKKKVENINFFSNFVLTLQPVFYKYLDKATELERVTHIKMLFVGVFNLSCWSFK